MFDVYVVACEHYYHLLACNINLIGLSFLMDVGDAPRSLYRKSREEVIPELSKTEDSQLLRK